MSKVLSSEELLQKYKETKNLEVLTELYQPYMPLIYGTALKYLRNQEAAEDVVMDLYEKISKKILTSDIQAFNAWIYMVAKNHCLEILRKRKRISDKENEAFVVYSSQVYHPDSDISETTLGVLRHCIDGLDALQKACIEMFYYQKKSYVEIAKDLKLDYNQVRSRIQNGRRNLKICIDDNTPQDQQQP
jgi:RNA polymerase sigma-70 factor (ECF subfamily)